MTVMFKINKIIGPFQNTSRRAVSVSQEITLRRSNFYLVEIKIRQRVKFFEIYILVGKKFVS